MAKGRSLLGGLAIALVAAQSSAAQGPSSMTAACVGGPIGCHEVDFTLTQTTGAPVTLDFFRIAITGQGWLFSPAQSGQAIDGVGLNFFNSVISSGGTVLTGTFVPFEAYAVPFLQVRAQFLPNEQTEASSLFYEYEAGWNGQVAFAGAVTAAPEPSTFVLLAGGLVIIGGVAARRRRVA